MAISNRDRVERILDALREGLGPFVVREYKMVYKGSRYLDEIENNLRTVAYQLPDEALYSEEVLLEHLDVHSLLGLMWRAWNEIFQDKLGHVGRSYVSELMEARNKWAHQGSFTNDEAYRVADTASRLLKMVSAPDQASVVEEISRDLLRLRYEAETKESKKKALTEPGEFTALPGLKPWREVVSPHPDVAGGRYIEAEFAADLAQVIAGTAEREYQDPIEFFRRTYLTEGLLSMLVTGIRRLTAQGGEPVVQLQTAFGGGKTHSMLALYHLAGPNLELSDIIGGERIAERAGDVDMPEANRAVIVGTAFSATNPSEHAEVTTHTLWGEIAYQLGGSEGYQIVEQADRKGVNPGSDTILKVLDSYGPCLIIIDELVAYARNLYGVEGLPAGSYDAVMSFMQSLTEAVRRSSDSMMLVSLPESDIEVGGQAGRETLERLAHIVGRIEAIWKPVTPQESFEIVRRRLFISEIDYAARDAVIDAFADMYRNNKGEFPAGVSERDYIDKMKAAYPIHPEMFDRLYEDWSTLERFQRTRGVLRLMAAVIHQLWNRGDRSLLIIPGTIPLDTTPVRNELLRYLPETWTAIMDIDIDGQESRTFKIDESIPALGRYNAARRVARTIFIGSAPSVAEQKIRGVEEVRIRLGCAQPGEPAAIFGDALRRMGGELTYLYTDGSRYWYDTRPTVNKLARDRAQSFKPERVNAEIIDRLRKVSRNRDFAGFHVAPPDTSDVADEDRARIVVLHPDETHKRTTAETDAMQRARLLLNSRGSSQRLYKNMLVFIAPDENDIEALKNAVREFLAWQSIHNERDELNLDAQQRSQVMTSLEKANETVDLRVRAAYNWLLVPVQPDPLGEIEFQTSKISGDDNFYDRAARKLRNDGLLIYEWSPDILRMELDKYIWGEDKSWEVGLKQLWEYLAQYCYLPRLFDQEVLIQAVSHGVERFDYPFAYATGKNENGEHTGLVFGRLGTIYFNANSLIIHPEHVVKPPEIIDFPPVPPGTGDDNEEEGEPHKPPKPPKKITSRFYGRVKLDPQRVNKDMGLIVEEVIERLTSQISCEVEVTVEIQAKKADGFDESTIRTISENSRTLKFENYGFEEG
jgi:predicted AAA+ superfamily ATPase